MRGKLSIESHRLDSIVDNGWTMRRDYHNWHSPRLDRNMELLAFGFAGFPVLVFPASQGRFFEYENRGMIAALEAKINAGHIQVFCIDSVDNESWYNRGAHPHDRVRRQITYEDYVLSEVLPFIRGVTAFEQVTVTGCSLGGYQCVNFALRHPDLTSYCVSMSGAFDLKRFMDGYYDNDFYFNNPADYIQNMTDPWFLDRYRQNRLVLAAGDHDICLGENVRLANLLGTKGIPHTLDIWTGGEQHDWPLWQRMAVKFL